MFELLAYVVGIGSVLVLAYVVALGGRLTPRPA